MNAPHAGLVAAARSANEGASRHRRKDVAPGRARSDFVDTVPCRKLEPAMSVSHSASMVGASFVGAARRRCSRAAQASPFVKQLID